ncbi:hypothetical protein TrVFT333_011150 [Trichoderma virens FT-333]|nr:hypothetical protein TrVFT333_011150 [Trichoderma virens FT-333]
MKKEDRFVKVIRSGNPMAVSIYDIVVGDLMLLEPGDVIPVDGVFIEGHGLSFDESSVTGESDLVRKVPADDVLQVLVNEEAPELKRLDPFIVSGARVLDGVGSFLVTSVGQNSSYGRTMMSLREDPGPTPLQSKLNVLADKTGTLTENTMTVVTGALGGEALLFGEKDLKLELDGGEPWRQHDQTKDKRLAGASLVHIEMQQFGQIPADQLSSKLCTEFQGLLRTALAVNTTAFESEENGRTVFVGTKTETALLDWKEAIRRIIFGFTTQSLRTLALSYIDFQQWPPHWLQADNTAAGSDDIELTDVLRDMTWIGVVGIRDPVRRGVPAAVEACRGASVSVKMVTGDNVETARAVGRECGILKTLSGEEGLVMEGVNFRQLSDDEKAAVAKDICVLARSSPEDKRILVKTLRNLGEIVAVTGDGTNDAPALKAADVGFSMGLSGTEVAKEASDIILMDDNFASIVKALGWGRAVNDSVKKFLQFQLTVNITAVVPLRSRQIRQQEAYFNVNQSSGRLL